MMIITNLKTTLKKSKLVRNIYLLFRVYFFNGNHIKNNGSGNKIIRNNAFFTNSNLKIIGNNNTIIIGFDTRVVDIMIFILGNNNCIEIGSHCSLKGCILWLEDNENRIRIGSGTTIEHKTELACIEGCKISIGEDCMFSSNVLLTTGDSHSIIDFQGIRINPSKDVTIGNHVWVGGRAMIMKGTNIPSFTIIGAGSFVNKKFEKEHTIIAGCPSKTIKENINWKRDRL